MEKRLTLKKVTLRDLDDFQLMNLAGAQKHTPPVIIPTEARETCNGCPTVYSCAPKC
jgi:hypothetical protein